MISRFLSVLSLHRNNSQYIRDRTAQNNNQADWCEIFKEDSV